MAGISIEKLAENLNSDIDKLLVKLQEAGIKNKTVGDNLTKEESEKLLAFLTKKDQSSDDKPKKLGKLSLKRKRSNEQLVTDSTGKKHTVKVVRRKERTSIKRSSLLSQEEEVQAELAEEQVADVEANNKIEAVEAAKATEQGIPAVSTSDTEISKSDSESKSSKFKEEEKETSEELAVSEKADEDSAASEAVETKEQKDKKKVKKKPVAINNNESDDDNKKAPTKGKSSSKVKKSTTPGTSWHNKDAYEAYQREKEIDSDAEQTEAKVRKHYVREKKQQTVLNIEQQHSFQRPNQPIIHEVAVPEQITVAELAQRMAMKAGRVIKALMHMGTMATINQVLDRDTAILVVEELGHKVKLVKDNIEEESLIDDYTQKLDQAEKTVRAPVVTIMGHVDHGKTSLLDYIRRTKVTAKEAGGITQHIGAYSVNTGHGKITFLDTPGHAAFSAMRARGANVTDLVILVVSADDGVMPQTIEAIQHAKAAEVPIIVAINKIDKPEADPDRVINELSQYEVIPESWGGENQFVSVSAKTGQGIDELLDSILLQTEVLELKAATDLPVKGIVVEARLDKGRGAVATILVQQGTMKRGDIIIAGSEYGKVRAMYNAAGQKIEEAGPSDPVEVLGLSMPPHAGDEVMAVATERQAREVSMYRQSKKRSEQQEKAAKTSLEDLFSRGKSENEVILNVIIKADVQGSCEALIGAFEKIDEHEVAVKVIGSGVGGISESDVTLAMASKAIIIGFNVRAEQSAKKLADQEGVKIIYDSIIYNVIDDVKSILSGMLSPEIREEIIGLAEVRDVFRSSKIGAIAGCMVAEGVVKKNNPIRVLRDNIVIYEGELESLRRFKDDVSEVKNGTECGIGVKNYNDVKVGDQIEVFQRTEVSRTVK